MSTIQESHALFRLINDAHSTAGDLFFGNVTGLGDGLVIALLCAVLMLFRLREGLAALAAFILSGIFAQILKRLFDMPRPPAVLEHVHVLGDRLMAHSFPSGHATSDGCMILLAFLLWGLRDWRSWLAGGLFLLAAIGRVYVGVHFPFDVFIGLLVGVLTMWLCWRWSKSWPVERWQQSAWSWKVPGLLVVVMAAVLGLGYHIQPSTAAPLTLLLPIAALLILMRRWREMAGER